VVLLGGEPTEGHAWIKIGELQRAASGQLVWSQGYVPPCLRLAAAPRLMTGVRDVLARAIAKHRELAGLRAGRSTAGDLSGPDVLRLLQLLVLGAQIPALVDLAEGDPAPHACFLALAGLCGQLATLAGQDVADLPKFAHLDLAGSFDPLLARLATQLGSMATPEFSVVPLERRAGGIFLARFPDEKLLRGQFYLSVKSETPEATVVDQFPKLCKIAAAAEIQSLVQAASPGLPLQVTHRPPPQLPLTPGAIYFALQQGNRFWPAIQTGKNMAIYMPPPFDPARTQLELLVVP
jgi:type VI secretion system protein ImpJ